MRNLESLIPLLTRREDDIKRELLALERQQPGGKRKREVVSYWLECVEMAKAEFESLQREVGHIDRYSYSNGQLGKRVKRLREQVVSLNEESNFPDGITIDDYKARVVPFPTTDVVLGETFRMNCEEVLWYLKNVQVSCIGIYGMGGVGKTTVMKHVHNQILADPATFGHVCWVTVSQNFSIRQLQTDIFRKLNLDLPSEDDEMSRVRFLIDILKKGKYILILDDIWVHIPLEKIGIPIDVSLCKVIVTTRSLDVCNKMTCQQKIKISPLHWEEAWGLFMEKLGPHEELTSEFIQIAKHVARRCGGLPLAIITMAASMRGVNDIHEWRNALEELKKPETYTINGIKSEALRVLEYSYNHLGDKESQLCFLSCALYPEDFVIRRKDLIDYCIVKGLIRKMESRGAEIDRGHTILNKLVKRCLLECSRLDDGDVKMHDLIREMALQIMSRKQEWTEDLENAMELFSTLGGASSSAPSKHDVFLSFRGEDTRHGFTGFLYDGLVRKDLNVYMDVKELQSGKFMQPELLLAIEESKLAIVILSENYADSTWCLDELAKIVECVETRDLILFPVFYRVDPSDVQKQRNKFDLAKYETDSGIAKDRVDSWRSALGKVGNFIGHHVKGDRYETEDRDEIVRKISQQQLVEARWKHDVFLSFRGEDTRYGFTGNLYDDLVRKDLNVYRDDGKLRIGKIIPPELLRAIEESKLAIVVLSENYAGSTCCLDELTKIVECIETRELILFPVFYRVDPSDIRRQRNKFDLTKYKSNPKIKKDRLDSWRRALNKVGHTAGHHVKGDRYEKEDRDEIFRRISHQLPFTLPIGVPFLTTDVVLGKAFRKNCKKVLGYLKNDQVSSIGIYGMGGVGKTTVMKYVYNQILADRTTFGHVCWVTVSQNFSIRQLQNDIFRKLNCNLSSEDDEMSRAASLFDILNKMKGKYTLILDDVWVHIPLEKIGIPVDVRLLKVIVTTRSLDVCNKMVCQQKIKISPLLEDEAWELFMEKLGPHMELTSNVIRIAKDMARRCGGLPLAIITMATSMRGKKSIHEWRKPETFTINSIKSEVLRVLEYSYNYLGDMESQLCFLSCALYPENFSIPRDELIKYCIAKGLIRKMESRGAEIDRGHTIFNELVKCCLLECGDEEDDTYVKMHELIREMALQIMRKKQQVMVKAGIQLTKIPMEEEWTEDLEVVSLIDNNIIEIPDDWSPRCPRLSALMLQQNKYLTQIPDSFFVQLCGLRVLDLSDNRELIVLPDSVEDLINLIALWLRGCEHLTHIPSLRNLKKLRDLDLRCTKVKEIPDGIRELRSLRCLNMIKTYYPCSVMELMELQQLEEFRGWVRDASDYNVLVISKWFQQLWAYRLFLSGHGESDPNDVFEYDGEVENEVVLDKLRLGGRGVVDVPHGINKLFIKECYDTGKCLLEFGLRGENARTRELKEIEIEGCKEVEWVVAMPSSSPDVQLPVIEKLYVSGMENLEGIFNWWEYCDSTPSIPNRVGGFDYNQSSFSKLKELHIYRCDKMKVGLTVNCLGHLPVLEKIHIAYCSGMEEIIGGGAGEDCENSNGIIISTDISLLKLRILYMQDLPSLSSIYNKGNIICDSIEEINLSGCTELKILPLTSSCSSGSPQHPFPSLRMIRMHRSEEEWWKSLELVDPTYHPLLLPFLDFLIV